GCGKPKAPPWRAAARPVFSLSRSLATPVAATPHSSKDGLDDATALGLAHRRLAVAPASQQMSAPYHPGQPLPISLDPRYLPQYGIRTVLRMIAALGAALVFSLAYA